MLLFIDAHRDAYGVEPVCKVLPDRPVDVLRAQGSGVRSGSGAAAGATRRRA